MTLIDYYFKYLEAVGSGAISAPEGINLTETESFPRAAQLQQQIAQMGIAEFVRRCAKAEGAEIPQELFDNFNPEDLMAALSAMMPQEEEETPSQEPDPSEPPKIDEPDGPRNAYEVLLDCCCLDENLLYYLIDVLKRGAEEEFQKLALVTVRKAFTREDFLYWFATKEQRAERDELICVTLIDACLDRLAADGQTELIAALICGDQNTFELFRCDAPELKQLPDATFQWFETHYLQNYYPIRYMLKFNGISFPKEELSHDQA